MPVSPVPPRTLSTTPHTVPRLGPGIPDLADGFAHGTLLKAPELTDDQMAEGLLECWTKERNAQDQESPLGRAVARHLSIAITDLESALLRAGAAKRLGFTRTSEPERQSE